MFPLEEKKARSRSSRKIALLLGFAILTTGWTLAGRVTINTNNKLNFGQGIYKIKACDGWINIIPEKTDSSGSVIYNGQPELAVKGIRITGLDTTTCKKTNFKVKLYTTGSSTPLNLYAEDASNNYSSQVWIKISATGVVTILNSSGVDLGEWGDDYVYLTVEADTHDIVTEFPTPILAAVRVNKFTVESGPNA